MWYCNGFNKNYLLKMIKYEIIRNRWYVYHYIQNSISYTIITYVGNGFII